MLDIIKQLKNFKRSKVTKVSVTAIFEVDYLGHLSEDNIDIGDVLSDPNNLARIKTVKLSHQERG